MFCSELTDASIKLLQPFLMKNGEETSNETLVDGDYNLATLKNEDQLVAIAKLKKVSFHIFLDLIAPSRRGVVAVVSTSERKT